MCSLTTKVIENICRTCMCEDESEHFTASPKETCKALISIFYKPQKNTTRSNITVMDILKQSMPQLSIETDDLLPKNVCKDCLDQLVSIHEFQQKCLMVENKLRSLFKQCNDIPNIADKDMDDPLTDDRTEETFTDWRNFVKIEMDEPLIDTDTRDNNGFVADTALVEYSFKTKESEKRCIDDVESGLCDTPPKQIRPRSVRHSKATAPNSLERTIGRSGHCNEESTEGKDFVCQECGRRLKTRKSLRRHEKIHLHVAPVDTELTNLSQELHNDDDSEEENKNVDCSTKKNKTEECNPKDIQNYIEQTPITQKEPHEEKPLACNECGSCFKTGKGLNRHLKIHLRTSNNKSEQNQCLDERPNRDGHESDLLENKDQKENCSQIIISGQTPKEGDMTPDKDIKQHTIEPHVEQGKDIADKHYVCDECGRHLKTRKSLKRHKRIHLRLPGAKVERSKPNHVCEYCQKVFCQSSSLKDHLRVHTGEQPYLCSECGKAFTSLSNMKQHFLRHGTARPYECPDCPKRFPCHSDLASHKAVHNKAKTHVCDICGAGFVKPYLLKKHKMYHTGEKNHKCDYCDMRFVLADQCRRHMRTHTGEKPYKCKYCVRAFAQSNDLIKHLRGHLGDNVYKCDLCPQGFRLQGELRAHFNTHKNDDEQTKLKNLDALIEDEMRLQLKFSVT